VSRRAPLPGASDLFFRSTADAEHANGNGSSSNGNGRRAPRRGSPRSKHDTKITVYLSQDELIALEQARLTLRAEHELNVDRGRLVREAVAVMLADLEESGTDSVLVRRLRADEPSAEPEETVA
jgi:hypothetical protein